MVKIQCSVTCCLEERAKCYGIMEEGWTNPLAPPRLSSGIVLTPFLDTSPLSSTFLLRGIVCYWVSHPNRALSPTSALFTFCTGYIFVGRGAALCIAQCLKVSLASVHYMPISHTHTHAHTHAHMHIQCTPVMTNESVSGHCQISPGQPKCPS